MILRLPINCHLFWRFFTLGVENVFFHNSNKPKRQQKNLILVQIWWSFSEGSTHWIHVWYIYLHLVDFYGFQSGKYSLYRPYMDAMGYVSGCLAPLVWTVNFSEDCHWTKRPVGPGHEWFVFLPRTHGKNQGCANNIPKTYSNFTYPPWKLTWHWKITIFSRRYICKWLLLPLSS